MKMTFLCKLSLLVMLLLIVFFCVSCSCGGETPEATTPSSVTTTTPITTGGTTVTTPITTKEDLIHTNPGTLPSDAFSISVGEKKQLTLSADGKVEFFSLTPSVLAIGDTTYHQDTKVNTAEAVGLAFGEALVLAVKTDDYSSALIKVAVRKTLAEGEEANRSLEAVFTSEPNNSPANETAANLGDGNNQTKWLIFGLSASVTADLGMPIEISRFTLTSANDDAGRDPMLFELCGSNDGEGWEILYASENESFTKRHETKTYELTKTGEYRYYRLDIFANHGDPMVQLAEWGLIEVGKANGEPAKAPVKTPIASAVTDIAIDQDRLILAEGGKFTLSAKANGAKSPIYFAASDPALVIEGLSYNEADGTTNVFVKGAGGAKGQLVAFSADGLRYDILDFSVIAEGACENVTTYFEAKGVNGEEAVAIKPLFDDVRDTVRKVNANSFDILLSTKNKTVLVNRYAIVGGKELAEAPTAWKFYGSNDGKAWTLLDERENETFEGEYLRRIFDFDNTVYYSQYKLTLVGKGNTISLSEIQLFELGKYPSWALGPFEKVDEANPILVPNDTDYFLDPISGTNVYWSNEALYNPAAVVKDGVICVLYRSQDHPLVSRVGLALSLDGIHFDSLPEPVLYPENDEFYPFEVGGGDEDPRVVKGPDDTYYMYYSAYNREKGICRLYVATSKDLEHWEKQGNAIGDAYNGKYKDMWAKSGSVICDMVGEEFIARKFEDGKYYMYFGEGTLYLAWSHDLIHWTPVENEAGSPLSVLSPRPGYYDSRLVEPGPPAIYTEYGILLIYNGANADPKGTGDSMIIYNAYSPGQVVFDAKDPTKPIKITENCFMYPEKDYELEGLVNNVCFVEGLVYYRGSWYLYYGTADSRLAVAVYKAPERNDAALADAIAKAEAKTSLSSEAQYALRVAKEAAVAAIYTQAQVDEITENLLNAIQ